MAAAADPVGVALVVATDIGRAGLADFRVRAIERTDRAQWTPLWRAYLDFYRAQWSDEVADATFARIFDPLEPVCALVADRGGELIGLTHYLFQRSTWLINSQCYLQDLYVREAARSGGVGRALIAAVVDAAGQAGRRACSGTRMKPTPSRAGFTTRSLNAPASFSTGSIVWLTCYCGSTCRCRELSAWRAARNLFITARAWRRLAGGFDSVSTSRQAVSRHRQGQRASERRRCGDRWCSHSEHVRAGRPQIGESARSAAHGAGEGRRGD